jgi:hypothetical protein
MYSNIDLEYESGRHLIGQAAENTFNSVLSGDYKKSFWPDVSWKKVRQHSASTLGVDSLVADYGEYFKDTYIGYSEEDKALIDQLILASVAWASLPDSVNSTNGSDKILQVHGDVSLDGKGFIAPHEVFIASLIPVLAASTVITGLTATADYRSQKKRDENFNQLIAEHNSRMDDLRTEFPGFEPASLQLQEKVTSRRHFLKSFLGSIVGTTLVVNGTLNLARWAESSSTPLQGAGEFVVDKTPGILYPNRHLIIGRTALVAEKTEEAVNMFDAPTNRASILFGNAHTIGLEVVNSKNERDKAIRKLADTFFSKMNSDEDREKDYTQEDIVQKLADTRVVTVNEIDKRTSGTNSLLAMIESVQTEGRYASPSVAGVLDSWDPSDK